MASLYTTSSYTVSTDGSDFISAPLTPSFVDPTTGTITITGSTIGTYATTITPSYLTYTHIEPYAGQVEYHGETLRIFDGVEWQEIKIQDPNKVFSVEEIEAKEFDVLLSDIKQEIYG